MWSLDRCAFRIEKVRLLEGGGILEEGTLEKFWGPAFLAQAAGRFSVQCA